MFVGSNAPFWTKLVVTPAPAVVKIAAFVCICFGSDPDNLIHQIIFSVMLAYSVFNWPQYILCDLHLSGETAREVKTFPRREMIRSGGVIIVITTLY